MNVRMSIHCAELTTCWSGLAAMLHYALPCYSIACQSAMQRNATHETIVACSLYHIRKQLLCEATKDGQHVVLVLMCRLPASLRGSKGAPGAASPEPLLK